MTRWKIVVGVLVTTILGPIFVPPATAQNPDRSVSWHSAGDSYSSGEGVLENKGTCAQSPDAYGPLTAIAIQGSGVTIEPNVFTACTGHLVEDFENRRPGVEKASLLDWGLEQGLQTSGGRGDVVTLSFGGNDVGFADIIADCLPIPEKWTWGLVSPGIPIIAGLGGCDTSEQELTSRVDYLADPDPTLKCTGGRLKSRRDKTFNYACSLLLFDNNTKTVTDDVRGSIVDFYKRVLERNVTDRGRLVIVGYPAILAPPNEWPAYDLLCNGIRRGDAQKLNRVTKVLDDVLRNAVRRADQNKGRISYVSRYDLYRGGSHELCGKGEDWLNGLAVSRSAGTILTGAETGVGTTAQTDFTKIRIEQSFHPTKSGHAATSQAVLLALKDVKWLKPQKTIRPVLKQADFQEISDCGYLTDFFRSTTWPQVLKHQTLDGKWLYESNAALWSVVAQTDEYLIVVDTNRTMFVLDDSGKLSLFTAQERSGFDSWLTANDGNELTTVFVKEEPFSQVTCQSINDARYQDSVSLNPGDWAALKKKQIEFGALRGFEDPCSELQRVTTRRPWNAIISLQTNDGDNIDPNFENGQQWFFTDRTDSAFLFRDENGTDSVLFDNGRHRNLNPIEIETLQSNPVSEGEGFTAIVKAVGTDVFCQPTADGETNGPSIKLVSVAKETVEAGGPIAALNGPIGFRSPSGNIVCWTESQTKDGSFLGCAVLGYSGEVPPKPDNCEVEWSSEASLTEQGRGQLFRCRGDKPFDVEVPNLPFGTSWSWKKFRCESKPAGVTCTNGHGAFSVSRRGISVQ
jgi:hypothetical protein